MSDAVSAKVRERDGEISATVDETNRVREQLGMTPLKEGNSKADAERLRHKERLEKAAKEEEEDKMRERIDSMKEARLRKQKLGSSLGEQLAQEEDSAAAWIAKSRAQEDLRKARKKEAKSKRSAAVVVSALEMDEAEDEAEHVSGALVGHGVDDFKEGESVVLTLADKPIVIEDGNSHQLNDDEEMLENVNLAEDQRRDQARAMARGTGALAGDENSLLHKYDEEKARTTVRLDASGSVDEAKLKKLAAVKQKLLAQQGGGGATKQYDLSTSTATPVMATGTDYLPAEPVEFKKAGSKEKKAKKLRKKSKPEKLDLDALADAGAPAVDHGSRAEREAQLDAALARARRVGNMSTEQRNEDMAAARLTEHLEVAQRWREEQLHDGEDQGTELGQVEFSETGEFCKAVRSKDDEGDEAELPSAAYKLYKAEAERQMLDGADFAPSVLPRVKTEEADGEAAEVDEEDEEEEQADAGDFLYEAAASSGMGAALQMARTRGMLSEEKERSGRMFDQKGAGLHNYEEHADKSDVTLQYYDEYGRKMTQKQAFRQLSWKFHGKMPSKRRREKRMHEVEKQMTELTKDRAMEYMGALQQAQQSTKSAHVVISGAQALKTTDVVKQPRQPDRQKHQVKKKHKSVGGSGFDTSIGGINTYLPLG
uniref:SART-1 family protein n=1 Tax=Calcidiscus leptoporus TaxID=127549 RepID=A0A7S0JG55_9EUKA